MLEGNGLLVSSMQRLNELAAAANGADGIPYVVGAAKPGDDSSVTTADGEMMIQMQAEKVKKIKHWKQSMGMRLPRSKKRRNRRFHF